MDYVPASDPNPQVGLPTETPSGTAPGRSLLLAVVCSIAALIGGVMIGRASAPSSAPAPAAGQSADRQRVRLDPELARRVAIRTERASRQRVAPALQLVGSVDFDATRVAEVGGRISGRVTRITVRPGDPVRAGQALVEIESAQLGEAVAQYLSAQARLIAARQALARQTSLAAQQLTTAQAVEEARAEAQALGAEVRGATARLTAMGLDPGEVSSLGAGTAGGRRVTLRAPIDGRVIARGAVVGQSVEPTSALLRIGDTRELWVQLDVFERDLARVRVGDRAEILSETWPGRVFQGVVEHVEPTIDASTRTARVRIEVENEDDRLRPGQFVTARLRRADGEARETLTVPRTSVLQVEGRPTVFVAVGNDQYEARPVELGADDGDRVEVVRGLAEGDEVAVAGAFALKSELLR